MFGFFSFLFLFYYPNDLLFIIFQFADRGQTNHLYLQPYMVNQGYLDQLVSTSISLCSPKKNVINKFNIHMSSDLMNECIGIALQLSLRFIFG